MDISDRRRTVIYAAFMIVKVKRRGVTSSARLYLGWIIIWRSQSIVFFAYIFSFHRCPDFVKRKEYVKLVDDVRESGGDVKIFSTMHVSGERE